MKPSRTRARARPGPVHRGRRQRPGVGVPTPRRVRQERGIFRQGDSGEPVRFGVAYSYGGKASANFGLKRYDQAIEQLRKAIAITPNYIPWAHTLLVAALALTDHDAEAREALKRYLALPSTGPLKTIAAWKATELRSGRRSTLLGGDRTDVRRLAQSRDARGMTETRHLAAILAADVVGYSRLMGEDEAGTARAVREHREAADADRSRIRRAARQDDGRRRAPRISIRRRGGRVRDSHAAADGRTQRGRCRGPTHPLPHRRQSRRRAD